MVTVNISITEKNVEQMFNRMLSLMEIQGAVKAGSERMFDIYDQAELNYLKEYFFNSAKVCERVKNKKQWSKTFKRANNEVGRMHKICCELLDDYT